MSVRAALTRTQARAGAGGSASAPETIRRASALCCGGTASSRSSISASAPAVKTRSSSFALCPGANR